MLGNKKDTAQGLTKELIGYLQNLQPLKTPDDLTITSLRKVVAEEVQAAFQEA